MVFPLRNALIRANGESVGPATGLVDACGRGTRGGPDLLRSRLLRGLGGELALAGLWILLAAAVSVAAPAQVASAQPKAKIVAPATDARLEQAAGAIDDGRYAVALELVGQALKDGGLTSGDGDWAAYLKARALVGLGRGDDGETTVRERLAANKNGYTWASLVAIQTTRGRYQPAAQAILDLEEEEFILVNRLRPALIESIVGGLGEQAALRDQLIMRLVEGRYAGPASQHVPDTLRLRYINLLLRQHRIEDAARQTDGLEAPAILSIVLTDKSFEALWEHPSVKALMLPGALVARVERGVQVRLEQPSLSSSDWLELMRALRVIGRADEAVRLGLHAVDQAREEKRPAGPALRLEIANAYADLGQAWAARRTAKALMSEEASLPLSLRVSIAQILEQTGDDDGALLLLATLEGEAKTSAVLKTTVCAAHDLGRTAKRDAALAALEAAGDAAPGDVFDAMVCSGQKDKAAAVLGKMFERPDLRTNAILTAQLYADPVNPVADQSDMRYRMKALVATAAVQDAIKPYARSIALPFTIANAR